LVIEQVWMDRAKVYFKGRITIEVEVLL